MATKISLKEADELSRTYFENDFVAFSWDLKNLYVNCEELPKGPSKIVFYNDRYLTHMIERWEDSAEVTKYEQYKEPDVVVEGIRNIEKIAAGTYGHPLQEFPKHEGHKYVDLGLPSGLRWSLRSDFSVTWGEVLENKYSRAKKNIERRCNATSIKADPAMDAARYNWGGKWRMPSVADFQELIDKCNWKWRKCGFIITGPNGNTLFMPSLPYSYDYWPRIWSSDSPAGEEQAFALIINKEERTIRRFPAINNFEVWPVFSEEDMESPTIEKIKIIKRGAVKIEGGKRMSYTISDDEVLTVKGDLKDGRDEYSIFPINNDIGSRYNHLVVDEGVTEIGGCLFYRCYVATIKLPGSLKRIGAWSFAGNGFLKSVQFSEGLQRIGVCAFCDCDELEEVIIPEGVEEIGAQAFYGCKGIKKVVLPSTIKVIEHEAFSGCCKITEIILPEGLESIGKNAFSDSPISEVHIPKSVKDLSSGVFKSSTNVIEAPKALYYILLDKPHMVGNVQVFGKAYYSATQPDRKIAEIEARKIIAVGLRNSAQYEDWREDCEFGSRVPFYEYIDCDEDSYTVIPAADSNSKVGLDANENIIDIDLYKYLTAGKIEWTAIAPIE